jgi:hypothetical protein
MIKTVIIFLLSIASLQLISCNKVSLIEGFIPKDSASVVTPPPSGTLPAATKIGSYRFENYWVSTYLDASGSSAILSNSASAYWDVYGINGTSNYYIKKTGTSYYLINTANTVSLSASYSANAVWYLESISGSSNIWMKNISTGFYINNEPGYLQAGAIQSGWYSAQWIALQ